MYFIWSTKVQWKFDRVLSTKIGPLKSSCENCVWPVMEQTDCVHECSKWWDYRIYFFVLIGRKRSAAPSRIYMLS